MAWYCVLAAILLISSPVHIQSSPCSWVQIVKSWSTGFMAEVKIQMEENVDRWSVALQFTQAVEKFEAWKGHVTRISDVNYTIHNNCYNNKIYSCQCFHFPYLVRHQPQWTSNTTVNFNGRLTQTCSSDPCAELSLTDALKAVEKTVRQISEDLQNSVNSETGRYRREAETFSEDENNLLKEMNNLINYFKSKCILQISTCDPNAIEIFRVQLESIFNNIKNTRSSEEFVKKFELLRKEFDELIEHLRNGEGVNTPTCSNEVSTNALCKCGKDICSQSYICSGQKCFQDCQGGNKSKDIEGKRLKRASSQECSYLPAKENGQWSCDDVKNYCLLKCNPGYASLFSSTTCTDGAWTELDKMECLPSVFLLLGGRFDKSTYRYEVDFYHPAVENLTCHSPPPMLNTDWLNHATFTHNGILYLCGGEWSKEVCSSLNMTDEPGQWKTHDISTVKRSSHSAVVMQNKVYFIGGFITGNLSCVFTDLPLEKEPTWTPVPNLSYNGYAECVIKIDQHSFVITGGSNKAITGGSKNVTLYNVTEESSTTLPQLQEKRWNHGCAIIEEDGKQWIVVAGGQDSLKTTERLDFNGGSQWESLGQLNNGRYHFGMGVSANGIFVMGGKNVLITIKLEILNMTTKQWKLVESNVKPQQHEFGLVEVPAQVFKCDLMETGLPSPEDNVDIANKCCFIIRSGTKDGTNQTYILTSPFHQDCTGSSPSDGCAYTLYTEDKNFANILSIYDKREQICFKKIKNPVCCSRVNGSLCQIYGPKTSENNIPYEGICSEVCKEIANCSSDSKTEEEEDWCESEVIASPSTKLMTKIRRESPGTATWKFYDHSILVEPPATCTAKYPEIAIQSAVSYPRALAEKTTERVKRSTKTCGTWNMWIFNCWHMFGYSNHYSRPNRFYWEYQFQYEEKKWVANTKCYYVKDNCCAALQVQCGYKCEGIKNDICK